MIVSALHLAFALLLSAFLSVDAAAYGSSECVPQEIPNMTIDISNAVSRGARFTDPVKAASIEECISACCSKLNSLGDRTCNLAVYDTRSSNPVQNCYLFFCPELGSCPMTPALEVMSFSFWTEKEESNSDSTKEDLKVIPKSKSTGKVQNNSGKKSSPAVQETVSGEPEIKEVLSRHDSVKQSSPSDVHSHTKISESKPLTKEDKADTPDRITSKLLHLANDIDKQLEKIEASSKEEKYPESVKLSDPDVEPTIISRNKDSKKYSSDTKDTKSSNKKRPEPIKVHYTTPELTTLAPSVRTSHQTSPTTLRPILNTKNTVIPSPAPSKESKVTKQAPSSDTKSTKVLLSYSSTKTSNTATTMKNLPASPLLLTTQVPATVTVHQAKTMLPVTQPNSIRTSPLKAPKSTLNDGDHPNTSKTKQETDRSIAKLTSLEQKAPSPPPPGDTKDAAQNLDSIPGDSDKSGLVAALVFGVMFLVLVIGLVSHKVSEARRRHQYTKLDYLINGMYVDT